MLLMVSLKNRDTMLYLSLRKFKKASNILIKELNLMFLSHNLATTQIKMLVLCILQRIAEVILKTLTFSRGQTSRT
jgi:hypothetical protein